MNPRRSTATGSSGREAAPKRPRVPGAAASRRRRAGTLLAAAVLAVQPGRPWLLLGRPRWLGVPTAPAAPAKPPKGARDWFYLDQTTATFGALSELDVELAGPADLARAYLLGDEGERGSVGRLLHAARPMGAKVKQETSAGVPEDAVQRYSLELPALRLLGLGTAEASMSVWGAVRRHGGPQAGGGPFMEIGSGAGPQVTLAFVGAGEVRLSSMNLDMRGALGVEEGEEGEPKIVGWVWLQVRGEVPSVGGLALPESVLRAAARQVLRRTLGFAVGRLGSDLASDFARWVGRKR